MWFDYIIFNVEQYYIDDKLYINIFYLIFDKLIYYFILFLKRQYIICMYIQVFFIFNYIKLYCIDLYFFILDNNLFLLEG